MGTHVRPQHHHHHHHHRLTFILFLVAECSTYAATQRGPSYDENYEIKYGWDHVFTTHEGRDVRLSLDNSSGSGMQSKSRFGSGFLHMRLKVPGKDSAGVVTAFYVRQQRSKAGNRRPLKLTVTDNSIPFSWQMSSDGESRSELDFEFLGNREGKPYTLQTNVITNGVGNREQRILLWFDPTTSFHTYRILWNLHQIGFFVDHTPIRVFKNKTNIGVDYPTKPMKIMASIWDGDSWATDGGQTKINWTYAPFQAHFRSFGISGCPFINNNAETCYSSKFWWNREQHWALSPIEEKNYEEVKTRYMYYDYCSDKSRYPTPPPECPQ